MQHDRLQIKLEMDLSGDHDMIVATLKDLSEALQKEVDERTARHAEILADGIAEQPLNPAEFTRLISALSNRLGTIFAQVQATLEEAASPAGSPEMFRLGYATFLERLLSVEKAVWSGGAPKTFERTESAYRKMVQALYNQVAAWPTQLASSAQAVTGNLYRVALTVDYDLHPYYRAFNADTADIGI